MSEATAYTIVKRENGLLQVKKMLQDGEEEVKRAAVCLIKNISRYTDLHADISKHYYYIHQTCIIQTGIVCGGGGMLLYTEF